MPLAEIFPHELPTGEPSSTRLMLTFDGNGNGTRHTVSEMASAISGALVVNNATELRALTSKTTNSIVYMLGNSAAFDGFGRILKFQLGSTEADDGSRVFEPNDWASAGAAQGKYIAFI